VTKPVLRVKDAIEAWPTRPSYAAWWDAAIGFEIAIEGQISERMRRWGCGAHREGVEL